MLHISCRRESLTDDVYLQSKEIFFEAQTRAQALDNHKLNIVAGFNLGTGKGFSL